MLFQQDWIVLAISFGGLLFDCTIPFLLLFKKTRKAAIIITVVFHSINIFLSPNIRPFVFLILSSLLLFALYQPRRLSRGLLVFAPLLRYSIVNAASALGLFWGCFVDVAGGKGCLADGFETHGRDGYHHGH